MFDKVRVDFWKTSERALFYKVVKGFYYKVVVTLFLFLYNLLLLTFTFIISEGIPDAYSSKYKF